MSKASDFVWNIRRHQFPRISNLLTVSESGLLFSKDSNPKKSTFRHFDAQTVDFLGKITPLLTGLFINVGHMPPKSLANFRTILTYLAPMLDEIPWLFCCGKSAFPAVKEQLLCKNEELTKLKMLVIGIDSETGFFFTLKKLHFQKWNSRKWLHSSWIGLPNRTQMGQDFWDA